VRWMEIVSYLLIVLVGLRLLWTKGRAFLSALHALTSPRPMLAAAGAGGGAVVVSLDDHRHAHDHHHGEHEHHHHHDEPGHQRHHDEHHHHSHDHVHDASCGHMHGPEPKDLAGPGGWQRGLAAIVAVGVRAGSGAIPVPVLPPAQGPLSARVPLHFPP